MRAYHTDYDLDRFPVVATASRLLAAVVVVGAVAAATVTAGPGNGYQPPEQWAAVHRPDVVRVTLPKVTVVGANHGAAPAVASVTCPKGA